MPPDVLVVIVTHNGSQTLGQVLDALPAAAGQGVVYRALVIDNTSQDGTPELAKNHHEVAPEIMLLPQNQGVGAAYNLGLQKALARGIGWICLLDQDSVYGRNCLRLLLDSVRDLRKAGKRVGAVFPTPRSLEYPDIVHTPYCWNGSRFIPAALNPSEAKLIPVHSSITSGAMYNTAALSSVHGFREDYFIDFVDHECHLRIMNQGWGMWWITEAEIMHRLGAEQRMLEESLWIEHEPYRYYYMARNMTEGYYRLGGIKALLCFWRDGWCHMRKLRKYSPRAGECLRFFIKGVLHAVFHKSGPLSADN